MAWDVMSGVTKMAWDVMSGVTKTVLDVLSGVANLCGMFCPGCKKWHGMFCPGMFCPAPTLLAYANLAEFQPRCRSGEACFASSKYSCVVFA